MAGSTGFPKEEFDRRFAAVRRRMDSAGLRGLLVAAPENVFYLTGLDHQGYFAYELLIVPLDRPPVLVARAMERATIRDQVPWIRHAGYSDGIEPVPPPRNRSEDLVMTEESSEGAAVGLRPWEMSYGVSVRGPVADDVEVPIGTTVEALCEAGLETGRIGIEQRSSFLPYAIADGLIRRLPRAEWVAADDVVADCRSVQSPLELELTRRAATLTDSMLLSAIAAAGPGVYERDVMAAVYDGMFRRGGTYPGFVPLIRSTRTIEHEHGTWTDGRLRARDLLFVELAGCVRHYHAPAGRLVFIGHKPARAERMQQVCEEAIVNAAEKIGPGVTAGEVYAAWQGAVDGAGLAGYARHHCGYSVGIGFPPSWSGGGTPRGLRRGSDLELKAGMVFHLMSWLLRTGRGDSFLSDTIVVTDGGCEVLTTVDRGVTVR
ncbi:MAG: Xaa-Pro peptidase family protein [Thermoanaerobaculia bacterium]|nr:Xaa-Pro peptidase family protein [Thermoanaerobaculia bacterium]